MSHVRELNGLLRSGAMSPRHAPAQRTRAPGSTVVRGIAIVVAVAGIGVGTWVLGSEPEGGARSSDETAVLTDSGRAAGSGALTVPSRPAVSEPPLSVAPLPPAAAERAAMARATRKARAAAGESTAGTRPAKR